MVGIFKMRSSVYPNIISYPAVLIDNTVTNITTVTNPYRGKTMFLIVADLVNGFIIIDSHQVTAHDGCSDSDARTNPDHTAFDSRWIDDTSFGNNGLFQSGCADFGRRKHARACIDRIIGVEQVEIRNFLGE